MRDPGSHATLVDLLAARAGELGEALAYVFLDADGEPVRHVSYRELQRAARAGAAGLQRHLPEGTAVAVLVDDPGAFVLRFWSCVCAGVVPVPLPAPRSPRDAASLERLRAVVGATPIRHLLADDEHRRRVEAGWPGGAPADLRWIDPAEAAGDAGAWRRPAVGGEATALIQFTSGSTAAPRGAVLSHRNVLHNAGLIHRAFGFAEDGLVALSWLPLYHDMGLVGHVVVPVHGGGVSLLMPNTTLVRDPLLWLQTISRFDVTVSGAPPFAYDACVRRWQEEHRPLGLDSWCTAYVGAQPVPRAVLRRFAAAFAASGFRATSLLPCYGLAEATLLVAGERLRDGDDALSGDEPMSYPLHRDAVQVEIVDPATGEELAEGEVGEIRVSGPSVAAGYLGGPADPEGSQLTRLETAAGGVSAVLTGDLGAVTGDRLRIAGRRKDMIIVRGANLFSEDLEAAVQVAHPRLYGEAGACVAGAGEADEPIVVLQEVAVRREAARWDEVLRAVTGAVVAASGVAPAAVVLLRRGLLPRTTSGKVARSRARELFAAGSLAELARWEGGGTSLPRAGTGEARGGAPALRAGGATARRDRGADVAVVGMACRFPGGADTLERFWALLEGGEDAISEVPAERWDLADLFDPRPAIPGKTSTRHGGFVDGADRFAADFFGISAVEAREMDPQQRILLETVWRALEHAGIPGAALAGSDAGVFVGVSTNDYLHLQVRLSPLERFNAYSGLGNANSICANRLSYLLDLHGPSLAVDTACSSSLTALHLAVESLRRGECSVALVGGVNLMLSPGTTVTLSQFGMLSPAGRCRVFDAGADGYVRSEGCGVVVLKPVRDAVRDGDRVLACLCGTAMSQDGRSPGITAPQAAAQRQVIEAALERAQVEPAAVTLIEAHGTGTTVGDPVEVQELTAVYGRELGGHGPGERRCHVGSVKASVGHLEAAAGVASLIKTVLALEHRRVPPQIHLESLNPRISLRGTGLAIATEATDWTAPDGPPGRVERYAAISSFGFGGTNVHAVLREPAGDEVAPGAVSASSVAASPEPPAVLFPLSARSRGALDRLFGDWSELLARRDDLPLAALATGQARRRGHERHRAACVVADLDALRAALAEGPDGPSWRRGTAAASVRPLPVAFLFPGQGMGEPRAGRELYAALPVFRRAFDRCAAAFDGGSLAELVFARDEPPPESIQPGLFALCYALAQVWRSWGVRPQAVAGHSLGEYAAAAVAGCLAPEDAMRLVAERARRMATVEAPGAMAAVLAEPAAAHAVAARHGLSLAAINGPRQVVLSGDPRALDAALAELAVPSRRLAVTGAYHSSRVDPILDGFERFAAGIPAGRPEIPLVSTLTGAFLTAAPGAAHWRRHLRECVRWSAAVAALEAGGARAFLEVGPGGTLCALTRRALGEPDLPRLRSLGTGPGALASLLDALARLYAAGAPVDWAALQGPPPPWIPAIPGHPFERRRFWFSDPPEAAEDAAEAGGATAGDGRGAAAPRVFEVAWQPSPPAEGAGGEGAAAGGAPNWIVLGEGDGLAAALAARLADGGGEVFQVSFGAAGGGRRSRPFRRLSRDRRRGVVRFEVEEGCDADACYAVLGHVLNEASRESATRWRVVYLNGIVPAAAPSAESLRRDQDLHGVGDLTAWVQALIRTALYLPLWIVTRGAEPVAEEGAPGAGPLAVGQAPLLGFGKTLFLEHPEMRGGMIDLASDGDAAADAERVREQVLAGGREDHVAFRGGVRYAARLVPVAAAAPGASPPWALRGDGVHLVTGGLGGLGLECARWLARRGSRRIALLGRTLPPPRDTWDELPDGETAARVRAILEIEALGAVVDLHQVDVTDRARLAACLAEIEATAPLRGVLHAAGVNWFSRIAELDRARLLDTLRIKVDAAWQLHELTAGRDLDCFVLFSSVSSLWGSVELAHYSAGNRFLDALAAERRRQGLPATSIAWGPWDEVGMSSREHEREVLGKLGFRLLAPDDAVGAMEERIAAGGALSVVLDLDWERFRPFLEFCASPSLFDRVRGDGAAGARPGSGPADLARLRALPVEEARARLVELVIRQLASVLQVGVTQDLDLHQRFNMMGMDSLTAIAFAARLESALGLPLPSATAYNHPTVAALADALVERIRQEAPPPAAVAAAPPPAAISAAPELWLPGVSAAAGAAPAGRRLFCFPYAGSGASAYAGWGNHGGSLGRLAEIVAVQLPGREERSAEPPIHRMDELVARLADVFAGRCGAGAAFFGHSLGALLAYGLACELRRRGEPTPGLLILSGCGAPRPVEDPIHPLPDDQFLVQLERRYPAGGAALGADDPRRAFLPVLRADVELLESWPPGVEAPLPCPIRVLGGADDPLVSRADLLGWAAATSGDFSLRLFAGGHLFVNSRREEILAEIGRYLGETASAGAPA